jgi:molybdopterin-guanine dinucleotide biosynthesis adapter protein
LVKVVAVVGDKHSGKTTVIESLLAELKRRGFRVGTIKEMVRIPTLDTPQTETDRYTRAGAEIIAAVPREETVVFIKKRLTPKEILKFFAGVDFAVLEGFETEEAYPKIVVAKTPQDTKNYLNSQAIAVSGILGDSKEKPKFLGEIPVLSAIVEVKKIADLVEQKALDITL